VACIRKHFYGGRNLRLGDRPPSWFRV
jgi:hypothetical protein